MKLSEAIRLGAMMKPQGRGATGKDGTTCALGAALEAVGERTGNGWFRVYELWPIACVYVDYPGEESAGHRMILGSACWILNDGDKWTRERIADWVATIEQQQEAQLAEEPVCISVSKK